MRSSFTITSPFPVRHIRTVLAATLTREPLPVLSDRVTFRGDVTETGFRVVRNLAWSERGMPVVATGRFEPIEGGTRIHVTTRPLWRTVYISCVLTLFWTWLAVQRGAVVFALACVAFW
jgi:hypothetical protein